MTDHVSFSAVFAQRAIVKRGIAAGLQAAVLKQAAPRRILRKNLLGAFGFGFALMGGIEAILGGPEAAPEEDPEMQGYPQLTVSADMIDALQQ